MNIPKNLCVIPFIHLTSKPDGMVKMCCRSIKKIKDESGNQLFFGKDSFERIWNSYEMRKARIKMLNNEKLSECKECWNEEKNGIVSKRISSNKKFLNCSSPHLEFARRNEGYISKNPFYLDLRLGNKCNLKCRTCNPLFSSAWFKEIEKNKEDMYQNSSISNVYQGDFNSSKRKMDWYKTKVFFNTIKKISKDLSFVYISGGEPFLIKSHYLFIDHFLNTGVYKKITIRMNTNLTYMDKTLLEKLARFKKVYISVSIDAYGDKNNWIRSPSQFSKIERNLKKLLKLSGNIKISIDCVVSVYNILYLSELIDWSREIAKKLSTDIPIIDFNLLQGPLFQQISVLPFSLKEKAIVRLNRVKEEKKILPTEEADIINLIQVLKLSLKEDKQLQVLRQQLKEHTKILDSWRKENFLSVFPEFRGHLQ